MCITFHVRGSTLYVESTGPVGPVQIYELINTYRSTEAIVSPTRWYNYPLDDELIASLKETIITNHIKEIKFKDIDFMNPTGDWDDYGIPVNEIEFDEWLKKHNIKITYTSSYIKFDLNNWFINHPYIPNFW